MDDWNHTSDILELRQYDKRFDLLSDEEIIKLWSWFSEDYRCAGWLMVSNEYLKIFRNWAFLTPYDSVKIIYHKGVSK